MIMKSHGRKPESVREREKAAFCIYTLLQLSIHLFSVCVTHGEIDDGLFRCSLSSFIKKKRLYESD